MIAARHCYNGNLNIHRVAKNAKINAIYYQQNKLDPIYRKKILALYGADVSKVWVHQDKASSHMARSTLEYMAKMESETGIHAIPYSDIPVTSPDASYME
jgi:hypothetical protein